MKQITPAQFLRIMLLWLLVFLAFGYATAQQTSVIAVEDNEYTDWHPLFEARAKPVLSNVVDWKNIRYYTYWVGKESLPGLYRGTLLVTDQKIPEQYKFSFFAASRGKGDVYVWNDSSPIPKHYKDTPTLCEVGILESETTNDPPLVYIRFYQKEEMVYGIIRPISSMSSKFPLKLRASDPEGEWDLDLTITGYRTIVIDKTSCKDGRASQWAWADAELIINELDYE